MGIKKIILTLGVVLFVNIATAGNGSIDVILQRSGGSGDVPLVMTTDFTNIRVICNAISGTKARVINKKDDGIRWYEVQALDGECHGKTGWVSFEHVKVV